MGILSDDFYYFILSSINVAIFHEHIVEFQFTHLLSKTPGLKIFK